MANRDRAIKIEITDSSEDEDDSTSIADGIRKRKQNNEPFFSQTGRPKRQCTMKKKNLYADQVAQDEMDDKDKQYTPEKEIRRSPKLVQNPAPPIRKNIVVSDLHGKPKSLNLEVAKQKYKWIDHDVDTNKIRCSCCIKNNLRKWFINGGDNIDGLMESFKLHQGSEEHTRSLKKIQGAGDNGNDDKGKSNDESASSKTIYMSPKVTMQKAIYDKHNSDPNFYRRDVYCLPIECMSIIPIPDIRLRNLLEKYGLKGSVLLLPNLSPAKLRDDISKAFQKTFNLRTQELLQFDYLALTQSKKELTKPHKLLHFDGKTVLSFIGKSQMYILLRQKTPTPEVCWKDLLFQEDKLRSLSDREYTEIMLSVMYRLSSNKHKKEATDEQKQMVDSLLGMYELNNYHQLLFTGNGFKQLVLFTNSRRDEAFSISHGDHVSLEKTFKNLFGGYFWNGIDDWCVVKVQGCAECAKKYGNKLLASEKTMDTIMEELIRERGSEENPKESTSAGKSKNAETENTKHDTPGKGVVVQLPQDGASESQTEDFSESSLVGESSEPAYPESTGVASQRQQNLADPYPMPDSVTGTPKNSEPSIVIKQSPSTRTRSGSLRDTRQKSTPLRMADPPQTMPAKNRRSGSSDAEKITPVIKKEPSELLPPPEDIIDTDDEMDRGETLYEEDLEEAIQKNCKNTSDGAHCMNAMWSMYLLQQRGINCDFFIMLLPSIYNGLKKPKIYGVHKIVFSAISRRIRNISKTTIKIGGKVTCEAMESVIEFGYTGRLIGISELQLTSIAQISSASLALDIKIDHYLQKYRPDFVKSTAKILVSQHPSDAMVQSSSGSQSNNFTLHAEVEKFSPFVNRNL